MGINTVLLVAGAIATLIGIGAFINPSLSRWINLPGGPTIKAIVSIAIGIILLIIGITKPL